MKHLVSLLVCCLPLLIWGQKKGHKIEVEVVGFEAEEAYLAYYYGDKQYIADTAVVSNGRFTFSGDDALDRGFYLVVLPPDNNYFEILVDEDQHFSLKTDKADYVKNMIVKGSEDNSIFYEDLVFLAEKRTEAESLQKQLKTVGPTSAEGKAAQEKLSGINGEVKAYRDNIMTSYPDFLYTKVLKTLEEPKIPEAPKGPDGQVLDSLFAFKYYRKHYFDNVDLTDARLLRSPVLFQKVDRYIEKLTYRHPDSIAASLDVILSRTEGDDDMFQFFCVHYLNKYAKSKIMGMDAVYVYLVENYYMNGKAWWTDSATVADMTERALSLSPTLLGRLSPNFRVQDDKGNWHQLHGVDADYTILYFWDYDCGHCKKITPKLAEAFKDYVDHPVKLMAVSIN
ncbi:MAG: DUF5106 domain-containing protein, partial [Bacteroidota bacterium]